MNESVVAGEAADAKSESEQTPYSPKGGRPIEKRWIIVVGILSFLAILGSHAFYKYAVHQQGPVSYFTASGEIRQLNAARQKQFANMVRQQSDGIRTRTSSAISEQLEKRIDTSFDQLQKGVDGYLEWYFSVPGSYTRMYVAITGDLDEWAANKIGERLLDESGYTDSIESLTSDYLEIQTELVQNELNEFWVAVDDYLNTYGAEVDLNNLAPDVPITDFTTIARGPEVAIELDRVANSASVGSIAAVAGMATAALQYGDVKVATKFVKSFISRASKQGVKALARGGVSAAATSFSGPVAIGIGMAATTASITAFVGAEYIALNAQETFYRPKMERDLREFIELKRDETKAVYQAASAASVNRAVEILLADIAAEEERAKIQTCYRVLAGPSC